MIAAAIPAELKELEQWTGWQWQRRRGEWTKIPISAVTGMQARSNDPETWSSFKRAVEHMERRSLSGVGFMFHPADGFAGVDLDGCRDPQTSEIEPWARQIVCELASYAEVSPSETGIKIFIRGELPPGRKRKGSIEIYDRGRFFTVTGHRLPESPAEVRDSHDTLTALHVRLFGDQTEPERNDKVSGGAAVTLAGTRLADAEIVEMARRAANGEKFCRLYFDGDTRQYATASNDGRSEADLALCSLLAFWCGPEPERIDRLFRGSSLCREKWLRRADYRELTISAALEDTEFYGGRLRLSSARRVAGSAS